jgi:hypothetical protein
MNRFWDWIDSRGIVRRLTLAMAVWMTWRATLWATAYAAASDRPGLEVAAIIAAATAPLTLFTASVFRAYVESRPTP